MEKQSQKARNGKGHQKASAKQGSGFLGMAGGEIFRRKSGDSSLDPGGGQRNTEDIEGKDHLVDSDPFCTDHGCQEYLIIKSDDSADKSCRGENEGTLDKRMSVLFHHIIPSVVNFNVIYVLLDLDRTKIRCYIQTNSK